MENNPKSKSSKTFEQPSFRRYQPSDLKAVKKLHRVALESTGSWVQEGPDEDLDDIEGAYLKGGDFFVEYLGQELAVMGAFKRIDDTTAEIKRMRVRPDLQRKGLGQMMLDRLEQRIREIGYIKIVLDTGVRNIGAQNLYVKNGYREIKRERKARIPFDSIFYEKDLGWYCTDSEPMI